MTNILQEEFFAAVRQNNYVKVKKLLQSNQININQPDELAKCYKKTALHHAARYGYIECLLLLLGNNKCDINARDHAGYTALHFAASIGHKECLEILIEHNCDINARTNCGKTAIHYATIEGKKESLKKLIEHNCDVNAKDIHGYTALYYAALYGYKECLEILIENNCDINAKNKNGWTALHHATSYGQKACIKILCKNGANPSEISIIGGNEKVKKIIKKYQKIWKIKESWTLQNAQYAQGKINYNNCIQWIPNEILEEINIF